MNLTRWVPWVFLLCLITSLGLSIYTFFIEEVSFALKAASTFLLLICLSTLSFFLRTSNSRNVGGAEAFHALENLAQGDLSETLSSEKISSLGAIGTNLYECQNKLQTTLKACSRSSILGANTARSLQSASSELRESVKKTLSQLETAAISSEKMSQSANEIMGNCSSATNRVTSVNNTAIEVLNVIGEHLRSMELVSNTYQSSSNMINRLGERSKDIGKIVALIRGIASQTNLLALNAAIEAARAGDHGRGFAVVSDEVRKLALQTSEATDQISDTVQAMQADIASAVSEVNMGVDSVKRGVEDSKRSRSILDDISNLIHLLKDDIEHINTTTDHQTRATGNLSSNLQEITKLMNHSAGQLTDNLARINKVADVSVELKHQIGGFKLYSKEDAKRMVDKAYAYLQKHGKEAAIREFSNRTGEFVDGELFVLLQDYTGVMLAYGGEAPIVGKNVMHAKDASGNSIGPPMVEIAKTKGSGWYQYDFLNPHTDKVEPKVSFIKAIDNTCYLACGIYLRPSVKSGKVA